MKDQSIPSISLNQEQSIHMTIPITDASIVDQGYTYNQVGFTYNQAGVDYGGLQANNQDVVPTVLVADPVTPHNMIFGDIYTPFVPPPPTGAKNGPGWFMYVNLT